MDFENNWLLSLMIFLPLAGAAAVMAVPKAKEEMIKAIVLITAVITALLGAFMLISFDYSKTADLQFAVDKDWIGVINSRYILGIDGMSLPLIALTVFIVPLCIVYTFGHFPEP